MVPADPEWPVDSSPSKDDERGARRVTGEARAIRVRYISPLIDIALRRSAGALHPDLMICWKIVLFVPGTFSGIVSAAMSPL